MNSRMREYFRKEGMLDILETALVPLVYAPDDEKELIVVKWRGARSVEQFEFHLCIAKEQIYQQCAANPHGFRVVFLGKAKDFPRDNENYAAIAKKTGGKAEAWILLAVAPVGLGKDGRGHTIPVHFLAEVVLNVEEGRLIFPETYCEPGVWEWAMVCLDFSDASNFSFGVINLGTGQHDVVTGDYGYFIQKEAERSGRPKETR